MLQLKNITKTYITGELKQDALKGIDVCFRDNEFVSILGQSGSGKTTMLNIIGGLDRYTSGDLIINNRSTKDYKDKDWDSYRNHSVGFIFQSYNLIPHQSILSNVELALTLAGTSKQERKKRAENALKDVGLENHMHKKPNQLSGGQMQRVAIARALVNNPDILLADEPTGALDSETSVQIMNLLQKIAKDKLVIMVTHNPDLAEEYSTRIINLLDGEIINDSNPYHQSDEEAQVQIVTPKKVSMSLFTALSLSFSNLLTKKGRTILTAFAGSIGIIGIALILSLSTGMQEFILDIQQDTLTSFPITIQSETVDLASMQESNPSFAITNNSVEHDLDKVYQRSFIGETLKMQNVQIQKNNLEKFKEYINSDQGEVIRDNTSSILYAYDLNLQIYKQTEDSFLQINPSPLLQEEESEQNEMQSMMQTSFGISSSAFSQMMDNEEILKQQYDVVSGDWPQAYNEVVVVLDSNNQISDQTLYTLGLKDQDEYLEIQEKIKNNEEVNEDDYTVSEFSYDEILAQRFKLVLNSAYYEKSGDVWVDKRIDTDFMNQIIDEALELKVVGILKPNENAAAASIEGTIGYNAELVEYVINETNNAQVVIDQKEHEDMDIFNNKSFNEEEPMSNEEIMMSMTDAQKGYFLTLSEEERVEFIDNFSSMSKSTYEQNLQRLGVVNKDKPSSINLYLKDFEARDKIINSIEDYNQTHIDADTKEFTITYTDVVGMMIASMIQIIDMITLALIGFVSISLIVSSIMIGIITYISVLERIKEIGILRSVGASKKDIVRVFIAETMVVGLVSGFIGIGLTLLINIPINSIIKAASGVTGISKLPVKSALVLIIISVLLTTIAGVLPARMASKKDPVEALRND